jgi:hypothetical protein
LIGQKYGQKYGCIWCGLGGSFFPIIKSFLNQIKSNHQILSRLCLSLGCKFSRLSVSLGCR